jgi:hypothetical protein|tara:strand:+ start:1581 stop:1787 length:207 start_codon:yes stop_codon:yes gene_type:complete
MSNKNEKINTQINFQIEDVMLSENINEKKSIEYLMDYYSDDECTIIFNKEYVINILKSLYNKDNDKNI